MDKEPCTKFCDVLIRFHEDIKLHSFEFKVSDILHENVQNISPLLFSIFFFINFMEKTSYKAFWCFNHVSQTYKVKKFSMTKMHLDVSDVIHAMKQTKYANYSLHGIFC